MVTTTAAVAGWTSSPSLQAEGPGHRPGPFDSVDAAGRVIHPVHSPRRVIPFPRPRAGRMLVVARRSRVGTPRLARPSVRSHGPHAPRRMAIGGTGCHRRRARRRHRHWQGTGRCREGRRRGAPGTRCGPGAVSRVHGRPEAESQVEPRKRPRRWGENVGAEGPATPPLSVVPTPTSRATGRSQRNAPCKHLGEFSCSPRGAGGCITSPSLSFPQRRSEARPESHLARRPTAEPHYGWGLRWQGTRSTDAAPPTGKSVIGPDGLTRPVQ